MNNNGKITAPITTKDLQIVLGTTEARQSRLCVSEAINKYSAVKPIPYPTLGGRCPNFRGSATDNNKGYFYGLHAGGSNWGLQIHTANWEYIRPTGELGVSPFRRLDFNGYNHNATPSMVGRIVITSASVDYNSTIPFTCEVTFNTLTNNDGVNVRNCSGGANATIYLCVAVDDSVAVMRDDSGAINPLPAYEWGIYTFRCPQLPSWLKSATSRQISVFLANVTDNSGKDIEQLINGEWVQFDDTRVEAQYITIPEAVGYVAQFGGSSVVVDYGTMTLEVTYSSKKKAFNVEIEWSVKPSEDRRYMLQFSLVGVSDVAQFVITGGTGKGESEVIDETDLGVRLIEGETYTYLAQLYGYEGNILTSQPLVSQTGVITI